MIDPDLPAENVLEKGNIGTPSELEKFDKILRKEAET